MFGVNTLPIWGVLEVLNQEMAVYEKIAWIYILLAAGLCFAYYLIKFIDICK